MLEGVEGLKGQRSREDAAAGGLVADLGRSLLLWNETVMVGRIDQEKACTEKI